jgi:hypothetical protein
MARRLTAALSKGPMQSRSLLHRAPIRDMMDVSATATLAHRRSAARFRVIHPGSVPGRFQQETSHQPYHAAHSLSLSSFGMLRNAQSATQSAQRARHPHLWHTPGAAQVGISSRAVEIRSVGARTNGRGCTEALPAPQDDLDRKLVSEQDEPR